MDKIIETWSNDMMIRRWLHEDYFVTMGLHESKYFINPTLIFYERTRPQ